MKRDSKYFSSFFTITFFTTGMRKLYIAALFFLFNCRVLVLLATNNETTASTGLRVSSPIPFGGAVDVPTLKNHTQYRNAILEECGSITAENAMKMKQISLARNSYKWDDADYLVNFAQQNNIRMHGHVLIWHTSTPTWVSQFSGTKEDWKTILREYITAVVGRYKGKIKSWDVVNEALLEDGTFRNTIWYSRIGAEYIDLSFRYANEADPDALLFYNDYAQEASPVKRRAINAMIAGLISRGVPVHGVGLQLHINVARQDTAITNAINAAAETGLKVHISEFDVVANTTFSPTMTFNSTVSASQKRKYKAAAKALYSIPEAQQYGFTCWGIYDGLTWISTTNNCPDWPLPLSTTFERKDAYYGILEAFNLTTGNTTVNVDKFTDFIQIQQTQLIVDLTSVTNDGLLQIYDSMGQLIHTEKIQARIKTEIGVVLPAGLYVATLNCGTKRFVQKIIIPK